MTFAECALRFNTASVEQVPVLGASSQGLVVHGRDYIARSHMQNLSPFW